MDTNVYKYIENNQFHHYYVNLKNNEISNLINFFNITDELYNMEDYFDMENYVTDQPFNILYLNMGIKKRISVYGYLKYDTNGNIPKVFFDIYNKITTYRNASAIEWFPQKIEVIFIEITEAKNKRQWIEGYPDLESDIS